MIRILFLGEIVGRAGITTVKKHLEELKKEYDVDYTIANGEGATNGFGIGTQHAIQLSKNGINLITGGEKLFYKPDMVEFISKSSFILRPMNYPMQSPGKSAKNITLKGKDILILNIIGSAGFSRNNSNNPFSSIDGFLKKTNGTPIILVQFHAAMSAEKATMLHYLDGRVTALVGTHTKTLTADAKVTKNGTAFISDNGRVGSLMSVGGLDPQVEINKNKTQIPERSKECWDDCVIQGIIIDIDEDSGKCIGVTTINKHCDVSAPKENHL